MGRISIDLEIDALKNLVFQDNPDAFLLNDFKAITLITEKLFFCLQAYWLV